MLILMATTKLDDGATDRAGRLQRMQLTGTSNSCATSQVNLSLNSPRSRQGIPGLDEIGLDSQCLLPMADRLRYQASLI